MRFDDTNVVALVVSLIALTGTISTGYIQYRASERASDVKMVEIGIGILRAPANEDIAKIRSWAMDIIEGSSGHRFTNEQRLALQKNALPFIDGQRLMGESIVSVPKPCSAFKRNEDGSWTQTGKIVAPGNIVFEGNTFKGTSEARLLDQLCGSH